MTAVILLKGFEALSLRQSSTRLSVVHSPEDSSLKCSLTSSTLRTSSSPLNEVSPRSFELVHFATIGSSAASNLIVGGLVESGGRSSFPL